MPIEITSAHAPALLAAFEEELLRRIQHAPIRLVDGQTSQVPDTSATWTNRLLNLFIAWFSDPGAWTFHGQPVCLRVYPKGYGFDPETWRNQHDPEYLWDLTACLEDGAEDDDLTWEQWLDLPTRSRHRGVAIALECEWGGVAGDEESAVTLMADDLYKLMDCPAPLRIFIHWAPSASDQTLTWRVFEALKADHLDPRPVLCVGFPDVDGVEVGWENATPVLRWLGA